MKTKPTNSIYSVQIYQATACNMFVQIAFMLKRQCFSFLSLSGPYSLLLPRKRQIKATKEEYFTEHPTLF